MNKDINYYMNLKYPIKITPILEEEGGGYCAEISDLYGCLGDGETIEESLRNLEDVKYTTIELLLEKKKTIPEPTIYLEIPYSVFNALEEKDTIKEFIRV